jgi:hypothetical protein
MCDTCRIRRIENPRGWDLRGVGRRARQRPVLTIALGVGAASLIGVGLYLMLRKVGGDNVVLYISQGHGAGEFRSSGERIARNTGAFIYPVYDAQTILDALSHHKLIKNLVFLGHGTTTAYGRPGHAGIRVGPDALPVWMSVDTFAREAGPRMAHGGVVGWAGCSAASNPGESSWGTAAYGPGGERSFIAHVRDAMARIGGVPRSVEHRGHSAPGHTTANPGARTCYLSQPGQECTSELEEQWGDDAYQTRHAEWVQAFRGIPAEAWISGAEVTV